MTKATEKYTRRRQNKIILPSLLCLVLFLSLLLPRCARIVAPTGGPKDSLPPVLLNVTPPDSTLHFDAKAIVFNFNEFIQLHDLRKQMIISPNPDRSPEVKSKLETLTITWPEKDTLKSNTTYIINMGNAIEDINEGNPIRGFRYVFSTGDYLDSLEIRGKIIDARTGLPDSTALVMLYTDEYDSVVTKEKPVYYARCDSGGFFRFQNLPHDTFKVFALIDGNGNLQYSDSTEAIGFLKNPIVLDSIQTGLVLSLFKEKETVEKPTTAAPAPATGKKEEKKKKKLTFRTSLSGRQQDLKKPLELTFNAPLHSLDSNAMVLQEDTTHKVVPFQFGHKDTLKTTVTLLYEWKENTPYRLLLDSAFAIDTSGTAYPQIDTLAFTSKSKSDYGTLILHFDLTSLNDTDSTIANDRFPTVTDSLLQDTSIINLSDSIASLPDSLGSDSLRPVDSLVMADGLSDAASLPTDSTKSNSDTTQYQLVIELYKNEEMIYSAPLKGDTWTKGYLNPGEYKVRVVKDVNHNGKWDRGCYYCEKQRQPEKVYSIPETFTIRANWKNDFPARKVKFEKSSVK